MSSSKLDHDLSHLLAAVARYARTGVRSTHEVHAYLQRRGVPAAVAQRVLAECRAQSLLDDEVCARLWAEHWARGGYAWAVISAKLAAKGFGTHAIQHAAEHLKATSDDITRARLLVAARKRSSPGGRARARLAQLLASRGFESDLIEQVLNESVGSPPNDD